ncbi:MAG: glutamine-hydrolyzing GMP synthase [Limnochordia bacterium]
METILVIDLGTYFSQEAARLVRALRVYSEIVPGTVSAAEVRKKNPIGIIIAGPSETEGNQGLSPDPEIMRLGIPVLTLTESRKSDVEGLKEQLVGFLDQDCRASRDWTMAQFVNAAVEEIRSQVGSRKLVCGLSGGIDSSVAALLVHKAVGDQLTCIFVDHGFMRKNEPQEVVETFSRFGINLVAVDAADRFLAKVKGIADPEQKRKLIGTEFIRVFEEEARKLGTVDFLVQGTIYPDVIESGLGQHAVIKSHHNVGGLPDNLEFELVEPVRQLFKDEVREAARVLGLPESIIERHPFPGPGLAVRVIGEITAEKLAVLREADAIFIEELKQSGWYRKVWQAFAVLTGTKTVGIRTGGRTYDYAVALRAVHSTDAMTAQWAKLPYELLEQVSARILSEVEGINRVVYDISAKPPATIEWE